MIGSSVCVWGGACNKGPYAKTQTRGHHREDKAFVHKTPVPPTELIGTLGCVLFLSLFLLSFSINTYTFFTANLFLFLFAQYAKEFQCGKHHYIIHFAPGPSFEHIKPLQNLSIELL